MPFPFQHVLSLLRHSPQLVPECGWTSPEWGLPLNRFLKETNQETHTSSCQLSLINVVICDINFLLGLTGCIFFYNYHLKLKEVTDSVVILQTRAIMNQSRETGLCSNMFESEVPFSWWCHDMKMLSTLLALCEGNPLTDGPNYWTNSWEAGASKCLNVYFRPL